MKNLLNEKKNELGKNRTRKIITKLFEHIEL